MNRSRSIRRLALAILVILAGVTGCMRQCVPASITKSSKLVDASSSPEDHVPVNPGLAKAVAEEFQRRGEAEHPVDAKPYHFLALSGGGVYGTYGVGVLQGWTASGTRPEFDVVTGISTGAIISTFAFLGPKYDALMAENAIENSNQRDLIRRLPFSFIPFFDALYTSRPLRLQIERLVTNSVIDEVAQAHAMGRRLYVGTTNLDTRKLVIWDMGAIASRGTPEAYCLYRTILLASSSVPLVFPAVKLPVRVNGKEYDELHVDGGASDEVIFRGFMVGDLNRAKGRTGTWAPRGSTLYVITNGKLYADPSCVRLRLFGIFNASVSSLIYGKGRDEYYRIYMNCLETGVAFRLTAVPQTLEIGTNALRLDREERITLFQTGHRFGLTNGTDPQWRLLPPGSEVSEQTMPRTSTELRIVPNPTTPHAGDGQCPTCR